MGPAVMLRVARAAIFAAVCVGISAAGHAWMAGAPVSPLGLLFGAGGVFVPALALAGAERRLAAIAAAMLAGEAGLHLLFDATSASAMAMPVPAMPDMPQMSTGTTLDMLLRGTVGMVAVHAAAGLICAWWLRVGERALFELLRLLTSSVVARLRRLLAARTVTPPPVPRRALTPAVAVRPADSEILHWVVRRGPPVVTAR